MPNLINLPSFSEDGDLHIVIETPRGSRVKFDYDPKLETFALAKSLLTGLTYPHDWGFVPSTKADDGDPIDVMVVHDGTTFPGIVLTCRLIGVLQIEQKSKGKVERNDRLFAVPRRSHSEEALHDVRDLSAPIQQELEKFFIATDELEEKSLKVLGWKGPKVAMQAVEAAAKSSRTAGRTELMETAIRFFAGGLIVSLFAVVADVLRPKSLAGLFRAAPSVALATLPLAFWKDGASTVSVEGRSMIFGAVALAAYSFVVCQLLMRARWSAEAATIAALAGWLVVALGLERALPG
jgi:inorganic pyrophosphatase